MKVSLALVLVAMCTVCYGQNQYAIPPAYGYMTKWEAMQQQAFENQQRIRQQAFLERTTMERNEVLDFAEQALRVRALKAQERYYRNMDRQQQQQPAFANPFLNNPFLK